MEKMDEPRMAHVITSQFPALRMMQELVAEVAWMTNCTSTDNLMATAAQRLRTAANMADPADAANFKVHNLYTYRNDRKAQAMFPT